MTYLALGFAGLAVFLYVTRGKAILKRREWRVVSATVALAAITAGAYLATRGKWGMAVGLIVAGLSLDESSLADDIGADSRLGVIGADLAEHPWCLGVHFRVVPWSGIGAHRCREGQRNEAQSC